MPVRPRESIDGVAVEQLVALADGTLHDPAVDERVAASQEATQAMDAQRRALGALRAFDPPPPAIRLGARDARPAPSRPLLRRARPWLAGAVAATCVILAIALAPGGSGQTLAALVTISGEPALNQPPPSDAGGGELQRSFAGVTFPEWNAAHGWLAIGARGDSVDGRATDTVYYRHGHHRIGYTVLSGEPIALPLRGRRVVRNGISVLLYRDGPRTVAVFERGGRTCVLAGVVHFEDTLVKLATWRGEDNSLRF